MAVRRGRGQHEAIAPVIPLRNENLLLQKKGEAMESAKRIEELYGQALSAMRTYQGQPDLALEGLADEDL
jgi:hypothetical protein